MSNYGVKIYFWKNLIWIFDIIIEMETEVSVSFFMVKIAPLERCT
jgi:hypothetical protein